MTAEKFPNVCNFPDQLFSAQSDFLFGKCSFHGPTVLASIPFALEVTAAAQKGLKTMPPRPKVGSRARTRPPPGRESRPAPENAAANLLEAAPSSPTKAARPASTYLCAFAAKSAPSLARACAPSPVCRSFWMRSTSIGTRWPPAPGCARARAPWGRAGRGARRAPGAAALALAPAGARGRAFLAAARLF
jgi:hypothetical protein